MTYPAGLALIICERIATGESLRSICRDPEMPSRRAVLYWLADPENGEFVRQYARAMEERADHWADEIIAISDDTTNDTHTTVYEDGNERTSPNTEWISRSKLRVDSRKWLMSKLAPKKYGERLEVDQKTLHSVDDSVGALMERIGQQGRRIQDK